MLILQMFGKIKSTNKLSKDKKEEIIQEKQVQEPKPIKRTHKIHKYLNPVTSKKEKQQNKNRSLKGSQFRILNQLLYTQDSKSAVQYFNENPDYCNNYHQGFREQTQSWQINPLDEIIRMLMSKNRQIANKKVIDLGCGQGRLEESIRSTGCKIKSYDIMQLKPFIIKADIAHLPIKSQCKDIAVFCLSLMGTNYIEFILQANRVLKVGGQLIIAEVESRCKNWKQFQDLVNSLGHSLSSRNVRKYFRIMVFVKTGNSKYGCLDKYKSNSRTLMQYSRQVLNPCIYKRR